MKLKHPLLTKIIGYSIFIAALYCVSYHLCTVERSTAEWRYSKGSEDTFCVHMRALPNPLIASFYYPMLYAERTLVSMMPGLYVEGKLAQKEQVLLATYERKKGKVSFIPIGYFPYNKD